MQIALGNGELGQVEITALGVTWSEYPVMHSGKLRTLGKCFIELDLDNLKELVTFYDTVKMGDESEGKFSEKPYYDIMAISYGMFKEWKDIKEEEHWNLYAINDMYANAKYLVKIN